MHLLRIIQQHCAVNPGLGALLRLCLWLPILVSYSTASSACSSTELFWPCRDLSWLYCNLEDNQIHFRSVRHTGLETSFKLFYFSVLFPSEIAIAGQVWVMFFSCFILEEGIVAVFDTPSADSGSEHNHLLYGRENPHGRSSQSPWLISGACMHTMYQAGRGAASLLLLLSSLEKHLLPGKVCAGRIWKSDFCQQNSPGLSCLAGCIG